MPRPNRHNEIELNLLTTGSLTYLFGGGRTTVRAGRLAVFWAAIPHQIVDFDEASPYYVVTVPLSDFLQMAHDVHFVNRLLGGELLVDSASDNADVIKFQQWERDLHDEESIVGAATRLEVQARLIRLGLRCRTRTTSLRSGTNLSRADALACYIARHYHKDLTAQSIAQAVGIHPNYAMSLFRETFGTTITSFITDHRICHAQRLLATTDDTILSVATASGFQSLSRFNEAFKLKCSCSPRDYRKSHRYGGR